MSSNGGGNSSGGGGGGGGGSSRMSGARRSRSPSSPARLNPFSSAPASSLSSLAPPSAVPLPTPTPLSSSLSPMALPRSTPAHTGRGSGRPKFSMRIAMPRSQAQAFQRSSSSSSSSALLSAPPPSSSSSSSSSAAPAPSDRVGGKRSRGATMSRTRARHHLSDGESDSEDPSVLFRSIRPEEDPMASGLHPPVGYSAAITASAHITSGSRAAVKSQFISATRSRKVAAAWAAEGGEGRVVKFRRPARSASESYDMTNPDEARQVFPSGRGTSMNTAKASQEVVIRGPIDAAHMIEVMRARRVSVAEYSSATSSTHPGLIARVRSRTKVKTTPIPVLLMRPSPASATGTTTASTTSTAPPLAAAAAAAATPAASSSSSSSSLSALLLPTGGTP